VNKLRTALSILGLSIGVCAIIMMLAVGAGAQRQVEAQFAVLGGNVIIVYPGSANKSGVRMGRGSRPSITDADAAAIAHEIGDVETVAPVLQGTGQVVYGNKNWATGFYGVTPEYFEVRNWVVESGEVFGHDDVVKAAKVVLLGKTVASNLFHDADAVGQVIRVGKVPMRVVGVLQPKGRTQNAQDIDDMVIMPLSTLRRRIVGGSRAKLNLLNSVSLRIYEEANLTRAQTEITRLLRERHRLQQGYDNDFTVHNPTEVIKRREKSAELMSMLLATLGAISLLTGGIGIMNIMLVSVTERTREIGLRMSVGARPADILSQFLIEALMLALLGGLAGILLGIAGSFVLGYLGSWHTELHVTAIMLSFAFAAAIGVLSGIYPARKASRLNPVEAMRYE
jgi:putative ABC transport system permease protein